MADQLFNANCGFFDSVNNDRLYSADDMNKPYNRVICNGVFATQEGTPSEDLQVLRYSGMIIKVNKGQGLFANRWFELETSVNITVPSNASANPRIDAVFARVDTRTGVRAGKICYRTGTPSASPSAPSKALETGVYEYRLANVLVNAGATNIYQSNIIDTRGSSECPWVTSLITQVDTSTLYTQWSDAYQRYYTDSTEAWEDYEAARQAEWTQFFDNLTQDLTLSTNIMRLNSTYTTVGTTTEIPVGIASYDSSTDILLVYVNGVYCPPNKYTYTSSGNKITLTNALTSGQTVYFVVLKAFITGDISTVQTDIQDIETALGALSADSGWIDLTLASGSAYNSNLKPGYRKYGTEVYLRGCVKGVSVGDTITTLPVGVRPGNNHIYVSSTVNGSTAPSTLAIVIQSDGVVKITAASGSIASSDMIPLSTSFIV